MPESDGRSTGATAGDVRKDLQPYRPCGECRIRRSCEDQPAQRLRRACGECSVDMNLLRDVGESYTAIVPKMLENLMFGEKSRNE